ncbi:MAG: hypothetical protein ACRCV0_03455 [Brevinema sp.]
MLKQSAEQHFFFSQQMIHNMSILQMNKYTLDQNLKIISDVNPFVEHKSYFFKNHSSVAIIPEIVENTLAYQKTLYEKIREELFLILDDDDLVLLQLLIGNLNQHGFLTVSCKDLCYGTSIDQLKLETIRTKMLQSSYLGLGAYDYSEYLLFITKHIYTEESLEYNISKLIVENKIKSPTSMQRILKVPLQKITEKLEHIRLLPKSPLQEESIAILPDIIVTKNKKDLLIESISYGYTKINTNIDTDKSSYTKQELKKFTKEALNLEKALDMRKSSLQTYAEILINTRKDFFIPMDYDSTPITLKDIAEQTGRNVSTISRALKERYFLFDTKIYPFSILLTRKIGNSNDFEIKEQLKQLLSQESSESPLTDEMIVLILKKKGFKIARRTIAKYRYQLNIGSIYQR